MTAGRSGARVVLAEEDFILGGRLNAEKYEISGHSASEWKEVRGYDDKWEVHTTLPNVNDYAIGDQILIGGTDIFICVDL